MISLLSSYPSGNAVSILLNPPSTAVKWRVLRNLTGVFVDQDDATLIYEGDEKLITDIAAIDNGIKVYYQPFYWNGAAWSTAEAKDITPGMSMVNRSVDVHSLVRDRVDAGLNALLARGDIQHQNGIIPVLTASPQIEDALFPLVTVHQNSDSPEHQFIGAQFEPDYTDDDGMIIDVDGYYSRFNIDVVAWSLNGDERKLLRNALKLVLTSNIEIFAANGIEEIEFDYSDQDDFETYQSPMYTVRCAIRCLAPTAVTGKAPAIVDVITTVVGV
jgi:hypothetical protein